MSRALGLLATARLLVTSASWTAGATSRIALPAGFSPEGIETGPGNVLFVSSLKARGLQCIDASTEEVWTCYGPGPYCAQGDSPDFTAGTNEETGAACAHDMDATLNGMFYDSRTGFLWVAGRNRGTVHQLSYDEASRELTQLASYRFVELGFRVLINDVVVAPDAVYATDSLNNLLYKLPLNADGTPPASPTPQYILLGTTSRDSANFVSTFGDSFVPGAAGFWTVPPNINWNGLLVLPDGRLLVNNKATGKVHVVAASTAVTFDVPADGLSVFLVNCMHTSSDCPAGHDTAAAEQSEVLLSNLDPSGGVARWDGFEWADNETVLGVDQPGDGDEGFVYTMRLSATYDELAVVSSVSAGVANGGENDMSGPTTLAMAQDNVYVVNGRFGAPFSLNGSSYACNPYPAPPFLSVLDGGIGAANCPGVDYWVTLISDDVSTTPATVASSSPNRVLLSSAAMLILGLTVS